MPYLITLSGPVSHTPACVDLTAAEFALVRRLARAFAAGAIDSTRPALHVKPLTEASDTEVDRLHFTEHARLERATSRHALTTSATA